MAPRLSHQFSGIINLTLHDVEAVTKMIEFFYTGSYNTRDTSPTFSLHTHTHIYGLALKYHIRALACLSAECFAASLRRVGDLEVYFQSIRDVYNLPTIKDESSPPRDAADSRPPANHLRTEVVDAALTELSKILSSPPVLSRFQEICNEVPQFHADFLSILMEMKDEKENLDGSQPLCNSCGPREEGYEIEVTCRSCGKGCLFGFH